MSVWMWLVYWWAGLTMEEVFLVTWGGAIATGILSGVAVGAAAWILNKREKGGK